MHMSWIQPAASASHHLRNLRPYTLVLSIIRPTCRSRKIGIALSDPYLSCVESSRQLNSVRMLRIGRFIDASRIGLVVFGLPLRFRNSTLKHAAAARRMLARTIGRVRLGSSNCPAVCYDKRMTLREAQREERANSQWSALRELRGAATGTQHYERGVALSMHAAVALQNLLDDEYGGWPNTFG